MSKLKFSEAQQINALQRQALAKINAFKQGGQSGDAMEALHTDETIIGLLIGLLKAQTGAGPEISMIELQSLVSQRATVNQMTTGMMKSINSSLKTVAGNIGR